MSASQAQDDAIRWNDRYSKLTDDWANSPRAILVNHLHLLPKSGLALDAAMGPGVNANFLIQHGLDVIGVDISIVALRKARHLNAHTLAILADLRQIPFQDNLFDVILNLYFLDRPLCARYASLLRPGGILIFETLTEQMLEICPERTPSHLLQKGELKQLFQGFEILYYNEGWTESDHGGKKAISSLIAVRPLSAS